MKIHQALTQFDQLAPGAMIFLADAAPIAAGDVVDVTRADDETTLLRVLTVAE